MRISNIIWL